jgi:alpha-L-arabinofuranosidase
MLCCRSNRRACRRASGSLPAHAAAAASRRNSRRWCKCLRCIFVSTRDTRTGAIYLNLVNTAGAPQPVHVTVKGTKVVASNGESAVLSAASLTDTNPITEPHKIVPVTTRVYGLGSDFTRTLPLYSDTVLKMAGS